MDSGSRFETLRLIAALSDPAEREHVVHALVEHLGAVALAVFVPHPDRADRLIPAPGFKTTLPSSRGWRELLARCTQPGLHGGRVAYPDAATETPAVGYAYRGITFVVVGHSQFMPHLDRELSDIAPLVAAMLAREQEVHIARGELAIARDATHRASALATALDLARGQAERATRVKDEFLAMLGHELRNPLAPIVTALQMMRREGHQSHMHDILERQVEHLLRLVDDLLDVSRITRGQVELRRQQLEIGTVVQRAVEMVRPQLEAKRNMLTIDVAATGLLVDGDPARLAQVIANLLTNASKYSDAESPITIAATLAGANVRITVTDKGIGLEAAMLDRVFDQFVQAPQALARAQGGLGLGLAIVRSLVTLHGGTVRAISDGLHRGSTFVVELPIVESTPAAARVPAADIATALPRNRDIAVLIVDDNRDAAELLGEILQSLGYAVRLAYDGPQALDVARSFQPAVAVLDIGLPVMDGYELARIMREQVPGIHLVAVTGYGQSDDRERATEAGFDAHLTKPVTIGRLTDTLDKLLQPVKVLAGGNEPLPTDSV